MNNSRKSRGQQAVKPITLTLAISAIYSAVSGWYINRNLNNDIALLLLFACVLIINIVVIYFYYPEHTYSRKASRKHRLRIKVARAIIWTGFGFLLLSVVWHDFLWIALTLMWAGFLAGLDYFIDYI